MFGIFGRKIKDLEFNSLQDVMHYAKKNPGSSWSVIINLADHGHPHCQKFVAEFSLCALHNEDEKTRTLATERFERYATMCAERGDFELQYNLGLHLFKKKKTNWDYLTPEDQDNFNLAAYWMRKSAATNFPPALKMLHACETMVTP